MASARPDLSSPSVGIERDLGNLFERVIDVGALLVIDVPIGLPDSDHRACDREARRRLRFPRSTSVFSAPTRAALAADSYREACSLNQAASGRQLSRQSYAILPKIREVDSLMTPERQDRIFEAHPEVTFAELRGGDRGLLTNKKSREGRCERRALLKAWFPDLDSLPERVSHDHVRAHPDDVNDALACLITAWRIAQGLSIRLPGGDIERDARGLRMEIVS